MRREHHHDVGRVARGSRTSATLRGLDGHLVRVAAILGGSPRDDLAETRDRVRRAMLASGLHWPDAPCTFVADALAPLPAACDVALACAVQATTRSKDDPPFARRLGSTVLLGELCLDGTIGAVDGVLPALLAAQDAGQRWAIVPTTSQVDLRFLPRINVLRAERLADVVAWLAGDDGRLATLQRAVVPQAEAATDLAELVDQPQARRALEVTAAGGHPLLFLGPLEPSALRLARFLPGLLPMLADEQALEVARVRSVSRGAPASGSHAPPFVAPPPDASLPAFVGRVSPTSVRPGALTRAHHGVLFLADAVGLPPEHLERLRVALEVGQIRVMGHGRNVALPTLFQLVMCAPRCPCRAAAGSCACTPDALGRHRRRLARLAFGRGDLRVRLRGGRVAAPGESSTTVRARVSKARDRAVARWGLGPGTTNASVPEAVLVARSPRLVVLDRLPQQEAIELMRIIWTLTDLADADKPGAEQIAGAHALRVGIE